MYICINKYVYKNIYICMYICINKYVYIYMYVYINIYLYVYMFQYIYIYSNVYMFQYIYIHIYIYMSICAVVRCCMYRYFLFVQRGTRVFPGRKWPQTTWTREVSHGEGLLGHFSDPRNSLFVELEVSQNGIILKVRWKLYG